MGRTARQPPRHATSHGTCPVRRHHHGATASRPTALGRTVSPRELHLRPRTPLPAQLHRPALAPLPPPFSQNRFSKSYFLRKNHFSKSYFCANSRFFKSELYRKSDNPMRRVTVVGTHGRASVPVKTLTPFRFDTTDARPSVPTTVTRRLVRCTSTHSEDLDTTPPRKSKLPR